MWPLSLLAPAEESGPQLPSFQRRGGFAVADKKKHNPSDSSVEERRTSISVVLGGGPDNSAPPSRSFKSPPMSLGSAPSASSGQMKSQASMNMSAVEQVRKTKSLSSVDRRNTDLYYNYLRGIVRLVSSQEATGRVVKGIWFSESY